MPARTLAPSERLSSCELRQWQASSAASSASSTSLPSTSGSRVDHGRDARVQRGVLAGQQVAVHGLADQRVAERVAVGAVDHEHLVRDRLARALHHVGGRELGDRLEQPVRHRPVGDRGHAHDRLRGG